MPPKRPAPLFDDDDPDYLDELSDDSDEDVKPSDHRQPATLLKGALSPAVYSTLSTRQLHGKHVVSTTKKRALTKTSQT